MKKRLLLLAALLTAALLVLLIPLQLQESDTALSPGNVAVVETHDGRIDQSLKVPAGKYPHGFPIEILERQEITKNGQRLITGYCRWHADADSLLGGRPAIVPVTLYDMIFEKKELKPVVRTITRRQDGYFALIIPPKINDYSLGLNIERAEGCPEKFKKHAPKRKPKRTTRL